MPQYVYLAVCCGRVSRGGAGSISIRTTTVLIHINAWAGLKAWSRDIPPAVESIDGVSGSRRRRTGATRAAAYGSRTKDCAFILGAAEGKQERASRAGALHSTNSNIDLYTV